MRSWISPRISPDSQGQSQSTAPCWQGCTTWEPEVGVTSRGMHAGVWILWLWSPDSVAVPYCMSGMSLHAAFHNRNFTVQLNSQLIKDGKSGSQAYSGNCFIFRNCLRAKGKKIIYLNDVCLLVSLSKCVPLNVCIL